MLNWCIVTLVSARLKAFVRFPSLRRVFIKETLARGVTQTLVVRLDYWH